MIPPEYQDLIIEKRLLNQKTFLDDGYLVVLDQDPKVAGHTLIISTKAPDHYRDITELPKDEIGILKGVVKWAKKIKNRLNEEFKEEKVKKVYVLSMCDHWSEKELREREKEYSTEHLHFHLIPRYYFDKELRGEKVLTRRASTGFEEIRKVREIIWKLLKGC